MRHRHIAAWLHIATSLFVASGVITIWTAAAQLAQLLAGTTVPDIVAFFGRPIAIALLVAAALDLGASIALLRGSTWPRLILSSFAVLFVWAFPIGTALAAYTFWALWSAPQVQVRA